MEAIEKARLLSKAALDRKAEDIVIMDMRAVANITDYFVICSASSARRVHAITRGIEEDLLKEGIKHSHIEGDKIALWVLMDYGDVIAHIFLEEPRQFYNLERLWQDAPKEQFSSKCISPKSKKS